MDFIITLTVAILFTAIIFFVIYRLERRVARDGTLFSGPATPGRRVAAFLLGIVFVGILIFQFIGHVTPSFEQAIELIAAIALIAYSLGVEGLLRLIQSRSSLPVEYESDSSLLPRLIRLALILLGGIAGLMVVVAICFWILARVYN